MRKNQGITLIALIITIVVMLILVAVTVNVMIQSNILGSAKNAGEKWQTESQNEAGNMTIEIGGGKYGNIEEYITEVQPEDPDDWEWTVEDDNTITITKYLNTDTTIDTIIIPNRIGDLPVKKVGDDVILWNNSIMHMVGSSMANDTIKKVIVSEGIEVIGKAALALGYEIETVILPKTLKKIDDNAFGECTSLNEITIPNSVTTVGKSLFGRILSVTVHVPWTEGNKPEGWDTDWSATSMGTVNVVYATE